MLSAIFSALGGQIVDQVLGRVTGVFEAYFKKQITEAELRAKVQQAMLETFAEVEKSYADSINKTFASFMEAASKSVLPKQTD